MANNNYFDWSNFGTGASDYYTKKGAWGSGEMNNSMEQGVMQGTQLFKQTFQNLMGRAPTADELGAFQINALDSSLPTGGQYNPGYGTLSGLANSYMNSTFGQQIADAQQKKQTDAANTQLDQTQNRVADLVKSLNHSTQDYLASPEAQAQIQGKLNNSGMLNSGAYSSTLAGLMAQGASQNEASALQGVTIPALQNIQGLSTMSGIPYQNSLQSGASSMNRLNDIQDFNMQAALAKTLSQYGSPSTMQGILGMASSGAQGAGSLAQGGAALKQSGATSYVCMALIERGLICESDLDDLHVHIMPALFKKGRAFWYYAMNGKKLVEAAGKAGINWASYKKWLFDDVMAEKDPVKAVDEYALACQAIAMRSDPKLWDEQVMRTGILDSLQFIPKLFTYKPFREALLKCIRIKTLIIYDKPRCEVHQ